MNLPADQDRLLADVLADENSAAFRQTLLSETLGLVRQRRRRRQAWRGASALAAAAGLAVLVWQSLPPTALTPETARRAYVAVHTRPLALAALVITRPFDAGRVVASGQHAAIVQTAASGGNVREIDDAELLALVGPKPAALVRRGPHAAELVFVNPADQDELLRN